MRPPKAARAKKHKFTPAASGAKRSRAEPGAGLPVWTALSLGVMLLSGALVLLVYAIVTGRPEFWRIGQPIAVLGQIVLMVGLVLQLDRLWHHDRRTAVKLDHVDQQLHHLKNATAVLSTTHSSSSTAFYRHFASGASPHVLLTDLKGQLDLLAVQLSEMNAE